MRHTTTYVPIFFEFFSFLVVVGKEFITFKKLNLLIHLESFWWSYLADFAIIMMRYDLMSFDF